MKQEFKFEGTVIKESGMLSCGLEIQLHNSKDRLKINEAKNTLTLPQNNDSLKEFKQGDVVEISVNATIAKKGKKE